MLWISDGDIINKKKHSITTKHLNTHTDAQKMFFVLCLFYNSKNTRSKADKITTAKSKRSTLRQCYLHAKRPLVDRQHVKWRGGVIELWLGKQNISKLREQQARSKLEAQRHERDHPVMSAAAVSSDWTGWDVAYQTYNRTYDKYVLVVIWQRL